MKANIPLACSSSVYRTVIGNDRTMPTGCRNIFKVNCAPAGAVGFNRISGMKPAPHQQRGATLIVALILLVLLTLFALTSFNLGKSSLQTVGNMQHRNEAIAAAQQTVEEAVSTTRLFQSPTNTILNGNLSCNGGQPNTKCVDVNGDGKADITVKLTPVPTCVKAQPILNSQLVATTANDAGCSIQAAQGFGIAGQTTGNSLCADSLWEVTAVAQDNVTGANYSVTEGIGVRVATDDIAASCP